jgi:hypothetical protein
MTSPAPDTLEREKDKLWVTDAELVRWLGVPEKIGYDTIRFLDEKKNGFPEKQKLWGDRRYKPAVKAYFDRLYGVSVEASPRRERA